MSDATVWNEAIKQILRIARETMDIRAARELRELAEDLKKQTQAGLASVPDKVSEIPVRPAAKPPTD